MKWLSSMFSIRALLIAAGYSFLLLIAYRRAGWRGGVGVAVVAFLLLGALRLRVLLDISSVPRSTAYVIVGTVLVGQILLPALLVHRMNQRKPTAPAWALLSGVAGYFLGEIVMTGVMVIVLIAKGFGGG